MKKLRDYLKEDFDKTKYSVKSAVSGLEEVIFNILKYQDDKEKISVKDLKKTIDDYKKHLIDSNQM
jgi:hypothetical protein